MSASELLKLLNTRITQFSDEELEELDILLWSELMDRDFKREGGNKNLLDDYGF